MSDDLQRMRREYARRSIDSTLADRTSPFNIAYLFALQQRQRHTIKLLRDHQITALQDKTILEVGCGDGGALSEYIGFGAAPENIYGVDLLPNRLGSARKRLTRSGFACADGQALPFAANTFDFVLQYTAFSSVLDEHIRAQMASEMRRVVNSQGGAILWYDFWLNPSNRQTRGLRPAEVRALFPKYTLSIRRVTLAPPLARRTVPISWTISVMLEALRLLNSHYLILMEPDETFHKR